jgi:nucleoside-diphosphate-sugar epimerase
MGKSNIAQRLLGDLQVNSSKARTLLGWQPPFTVAQGLAASVGV